MSQANKEKEAYIEIKSKMSDLMFDFTNKYASKGEHCLYPQCAQILVKAMEELLKEAKYQAYGRHEDEKEYEDDTPYIKYRKIISAFKDELEIVEQRIRDIEQTFSDGQRATQVGVQNVYDKFNELEERQKAIEDLLKSDHIMEIVKLIPKEEDIIRMINKIDSSAVARLKEKIHGVKEDLEELVDRFTF